MHRRLSLTSPIALMGAIVLAALVVSGCSVVRNNGRNTTQIGSAPYTEGSGRTASETRGLAAFQAVSVENGLTVFVSRGARPSVRVTADDNLLAMIATEVSSGTLRISVEGNLRTHGKLEVEVTCADRLESIAQSSGSTMDIEDVGPDAIAISVQGGSTLRAGGFAGTLQLDVSGGSTADLRNVQTQTAHVKVDGGSTALVRAASAIDGSCHGGSTVMVSGGADPSAVDRDSGSSVVRDRD
jgi:hypothetical protein